MTRSEQIAGQLPSLRRYARALSGSQASGDTYVRVMLEGLITEPTLWDSQVPPRIAAFKLFHRVWAAIAQPIAAAVNIGDGSLKVADERLASLPALNRQVLLLVAMEGFGKGDVADILDRSISEIDTLLAEANDEIAAMTKARVLIIEDEPLIALDLSGLVEDQGHDVAGVCATRDEAVATAAEARPDLILCDIQLADGSSGIDAAADILGHFDVPIIFITAFPDRLLTGRKVEPTFLITKPFQPSAVRAAIGQALFFRQNARRLA